MTEADDRRGGPEESGREAASEDQSAADRFPRINAASTRVQGLKPTRVLLHYLQADANLMAAGMSFQALFAVFAAVFVGFSVAGLWVASDTQLTETLIQLIDRFVPGLIGDDGFIDPDSFTSSSFGLTGIISLIGLLWTLIAWLYYTRQAVRAIFGLPRDSRPYVLQKVFDLLLALGIGLLLVVGAGVSIVSTAALSWILGLLGVASDSFWDSLVTSLVGLIVAVFINFVTLGGTYRLLSNIRIPWRDLLTGAGLGSIALAILSVGSSWVIAGASSNPLFTTVAVFVGLLLWFNLVSRVMLYAAAWIAVGLDDKDVALMPVTEEQRQAELDQARQLVAQADLDRAEQEYADARGLTKLVARRRVRKARRDASS